MCFGRRRFRVRRYPARLGFSAVIAPGVMLDRRWARCSRSAISRAGTSGSWSTRRCPRRHLPRLA